MKLRERYAKLDLDNSGLITKKEPLGFPGQGADQGDRKHDAHRQRGEDGDGGRQGQEAKRQEHAQEGRKQNHRGGGVKKHPVSLYSFILNIIQVALYISARTTFVPGDWRLSSMPRQREGLQMKKKLVSNINEFKAQSAKMSNQIACLSL